MSYEARNYPNRRNLSVLPSEFGASLSGHVVEQMVCGIGEDAEQRQRHEVSETDVKVKGTGQVQRPLVRRPEVRDRLVHRDG